MSPRTITFYGAKGGQGTSTVAASLALLLSRQEHKTLLVDITGSQELWPLLGFALNESTESVLEVNEHLTLCTQQRTKDGPYVKDFDVVIHDVGVLKPDQGSMADVLILVIRPCYLSLRRAIALSVRPHGIVLVKEQGRALGARDVADTIGAPVWAEVPVEESIARSVDAGLLATRLNRTVARALESLETQLDLHIGGRTTAKGKAG